MKHSLLISLCLLFIACGKSGSETTEHRALAPPVNTPATSPSATTETVSSATSANYCCPDGVKPNLGKIVEVKGVLQNTRLAPSINAKGFSVYCMDVLMPDGAHGKQAIATGRLERTDQYAARVTKDGGHIAGTGGGDLVLSGCKLQVIENE
jgi:hypothetical protein